MGLQCRTYVEKRPGQTLRPGDVIKGKINYSLTSNMAVSRVEMVLSGKAYCRWKVRRQREDIIYVGRETFFKQTLDLLQQNKSFNDSKNTLEVGTYTQEFIFFLSDNVPYSYEENMNYIKYSLKVTFVRPDFFKINCCFRHKLSIVPELNIFADAYTTYRSPFTVDVVRPQTIFFKKVGEVLIKLQLQKTCAIPGEIIPVYVYIENNTELTLPCVKAKIFKIRRLTSNRVTIRHKETFYTVNKASSSEAIPGGGKKSVSYELIVPLDAVPSLLHCNIICIEYILRVKICFPGMRRDARLDVPLLIGWMPPQIILNKAGEDDTKLFCEPPAYEKWNTNEPSSSRQERPPSYEAPPSYWEVMQLEDESEDEDG